MFVSLIFSLTALKKGLIDAIRAELKQYFAQGKFISRTNDVKKNLFKHDKRVDPFFVNILRILKEQCLGIHLVATGI